MSRGRPGFHQDPLINIRGLTPEGRAAFRAMGNQIRLGADKVELMRAFLKQHGTKAQQRAFEGDVRAHGEKV